MTADRVRLAMYSGVKWSPSGPNTTLPRMFSTAATHLAHVRVSKTAKKTSHAPVPLGSVQSLPGFVLGDVLRPAHAQRQEDHAKRNQSPHPR
jgi:hypothetical protein